MSEKDSNSLSESKNHSENKWKELLYNLFYEIKSEILGTKIEIEEDEYQENIRLITIPKLISYIHDSIQILISKKIEISKNSQKLEDQKFYTEQLTSSQKQLLSLDASEQEKYENIIRKLEEKERILYKNNFYHKLQKEAMENKIEEYIEMEDEFEEMKIKYKYENGRFLNNDRKDSEILILRSENSKLKNSIKEMENNVIKLEKLNEEKKNKISKLTDEINELKIKIETKQSELNLSQNYFYNKTHNLTKNNTNTNTIKCKGLIHNEENSNDKKLKNYYKLSNGKSKNKEKDKEEHNNTVKYYRNQNINLNQAQFSKVKPKILSYKRKSDGNNHTKISKGNTNNGNKDLLNNTRNECTERLNYKYFSGSNIEKHKNNNVGNNNSINKKKNGVKNNNQIIYGKFSYLFNKKNNNINNNIYSIKKIISSGSIKSSRPHSTKKNIKKQNGSVYRSSSGE
jgi:hypothetical protein